MTNVKLPAHLAYKLLTGAAPSNADTLSEHSEDFMLAPLKRAPAQAMLRIGWIQNGRLCEDKILQPGQTLTVGEDGRSALQVKGMAAQTVMVWKNGEYVLTLSKTMEGKVEIGGKSLLVSEVAQTSTHLNLPIGSKGKLVFPEGNLLVQVLLATAPAANSTNDWLSRDESLFDGLLLLFGMTAACFSVWLQGQPIQQEMPIEDVIGYTDIASIQPTPPVIVAPPKEIKPSDKNGPRTQSHAPSGPTGPTTARSAEEVAKSMVNLMDIEGLLQKDKDFISAAPVVKAIPTEGPAPMGFRSAPTVDINDQPSEPINIPVASRNPVKGPQGADNSLFARKAVVEEDNLPETGLDADPAKVLKVIQASRGGIEACTATALNLDPSLHARLSLFWNIREGKVVGASIRGGKDEALNTCVLGVVRRMHFPADVTTDGVSYTWVVMGQ